MKFSGRERLLVSLMVVLGAVAVWYFFAYGPLQQRKAQLTATLQRQKAELARMESIAAQRVALEQEFAARQERIQAIEAKLPPAREIPNLLRQMQAVAVESGVKLTLLRPGPTEAPAAAPAAPPAGQQPAGQQPAPAQAPIYRQFRVELAFEGNYDKVLTFLRRLENFPRFVAITQFTLAAQELPLLRLAVTSNTFVLPESSR